MVPRFDVFSGKLQGNDALWLGCAENLDKAEEIMKEMAVEKPGRYFVFSPAESKVVTTIDTSSAGVAIFTPAFETPIDSSLPHKPVRA